jgi:hypothetical protein
MSYIQFLSLGQKEGAFMMNREEREVLEQFKLEVKKMLGVVWIGLSFSVPGRGGMRRQILTSTCW